MQQVHSQGIYHALPTWPSNTETTNLTALITGANGISGHHMLRVLSRTPDRWSKIYCLSRRPPYIPSDLLASNSTTEIIHISVDFLKSSDTIASALKSHGVTHIDHVFFYSYVQPPPLEGKGLWSDASEMTRQNTLLLTNFLSALQLSDLYPKRFMLQTGAKNYGGHLGPTKCPQVESDPRIEIEGQPNFYYSQEDAMFKFCEESGGKTGWCICMPGPIVGAVPDAAMNVAFPLAVYATVCRELGEVLKWPGDVYSWQVAQSMSSATMNAYMEEWAVLEPKAANQKFNTWDDSVFAWEGFWPKMAGWFGIKWEGPKDGEKYAEKETGFCPRGYGGKGVSRRVFSMVEWAKSEKVKEAWKRITEREGLSQKELVDVERVFGFLDGSLVRSSCLMMSTNKARKLGWHGFVDSSEAILEVFDDLAKLKMIPPVPKVKVDFD